MEAPEGLTIYVLTLNEEANIRRLLEGLGSLRDVTTVLDSGSTDKTLDIVEEFSVKIRPHSYEDHCRTYNDLTQRHSNDESLIVLDADMVATPELVQEAFALLSRGDKDVVLAPVDMYWEGRPLPHASMYPPKPFMFRGGKTYFIESGHGERLKDWVSTALTSKRLVHDDRKPYEQYLLRQWRYARQLSQRAQHGRVTWRDRLRLRTPIGIVATPLLSLVRRAGFLDGKAALLYALDRLIAEAMFFRSGLLGTAESPEEEK